MSRHTVIFTIAGCIALIAAACSTGDSAEQLAAQDARLVALESQLGLLEDDIATRDVKIDRLSGELASALTQLDQVVPGDGVIRGRRIELVNPDGDVTVALTSNGRVTAKTLNLRGNDEKAVATLSSERLLLRHDERSVSIELRAGATGVGSLRFLSSRGEERINLSLDEGEILSTLAINRHDGTRSIVLSTADEDHQILGFYTPDEELRARLHGSDVSGGAASLNLTGEDGRVSLRTAPPRVSISNADESTRILSFIGPSGVPEILIQEGLVFEETDPGA